VEPTLPATMRTWTLVAPSTFQEQRVATPEPSRLEPGEVLVRVLARGICGSDIPYFRGAPPRVLPGLANSAGVSSPGCPLHEVVGDVLVSQHPLTPVGARVVGWASRTDGLSDYIVTDGDSVFEYQHALDPATAVMLQPLACVLFAVGKLHAVAGLDVAVIGQGSIGVLFSHVLKSKGVRRVTGVDRIDRTVVAPVFGVDNMVHSSSRSWVASLPEARRPNVVVEVVGHQLGTLQDAIEAVAAGGCVYYYGIPDDRVYPFPIHLFQQKNATLQAGYTQERRANLQAADQYLRANPELAASYVTHKFKADEVQLAFEAASHPAVGQLKVVMEAG
jgi:L-iditol 2-dehydrogenase